MSGTEKRSKVEEIPSTSRLGISGSSYELSKEQVDAFHRDGYVTLKVCCV
jgi:hypothetical protein